MDELKLQMPMRGRFDPHAIRYLLTMNKQVKPGITEKKLQEVDRYLNEGAAVCDICLTAEVGRLREKWLGAMTKMIVWLRNEEYMMHKFGDLTTAIKADLSPDPVAPEEFLVQLVTKTGEITEKLDRIASSILKLEMKRSRDEIQADRATMEQLSSKKAKIEGFWIVLVREMMLRSQRKLNFFQRNCAEFLDHIKDSIKKGTKSSVLVNEINEYLISSLGIQVPKDNSELVAQELEVEDPLDHFLKDDKCHFRVPDNKGDEEHVLELTLEQSINSQRSLLNQAMVESHSVLEKMTPMPNQSELVNPSPPPFVDDANLGEKLRDPTYIPEEKERLLFGFLEQNFFAISRKGFEVTREEVMNVPRDPTLKPEEPEKLNKSQKFNQVIKLDDMQDTLQDIAEMLGEPQPAKQNKPRNAIPHIQDGDLVIGNLLKDDKHGLDQSRGESKPPETKGTRKTPNKNGGQLPRTLFHGDEIITPVKRILNRVIHTETTAESSSAKGKRYRNSKKRSVDINCSHELEGERAMQSWINENSRVHKASRSTSTRDEGRLVTNVKYSASIQKESASKQQQAPYWPYMNFRSRKFKPTGKEKA